MSEPHIVHDADRPPTAADALAIIEREQAHASSKLAPNIAAFYGIWGMVWLASGVLFFLTASAAAAGWATAALVVTGTVISAVIGVRSGRGITGTSSRQGLLYGLSWPISITALGVLVGRMGALGVPGSVMAVLSPALFALLVGALYLVAGAIWTSPVDYALGGWVMAVAVTSVFIGLPGSPLVLGLGAGGGLLVRAGLSLVKGRNTCS